MTVSLISKVAEGENNKHKPKIVVNSPHKENEHGLAPARFTGTTTSPAPVHPTANRLHCLFWPAHEPDCLVHRRSGVSSSLLMTTTSEALVETADFVLEKIKSLQTTEFLRRGRKYRFVNSTFQRVQEEDKHLVVSPASLSDNVSTISAYNILSRISPEIFETHKDLCLIIMGVARRLEENAWYETDASSVVQYDTLSTAFTLENASAALQFAKEIAPAHLEKGYILLYCAKLNFLHTDHHVGVRLEGQYMREYVEKYFGEEAVESPVVVSALKSFAHWASVKGLLYKLQVPFMNVDASLEQKFASFPDPPPELSKHVYARFPSGTSKYSLLLKALELLAEYKYSRLIPYPESPVFDARWVFELCSDITNDPIKYHLRSKTKGLSANPVNLVDLSQQRSAQLDSLMSLAGVVIHTFGDTKGEYLLQNSKISSLCDKFTEDYPEYYERLTTTADEINDYESKEWAVEDIVLRMYTARYPNFHDVIEKAKDCN